MGRSSWVVVFRGMPMFALAALIIMLFLLYWSVICIALGIGGEAALYRADCEAEAGNVKEALKWCDEAIRRDPELIPAYYLRATLHERQGDYRSALHDYTMIIRLQPDVPDNHFDRGRAYEALGDLDSAVSDYCDAILSDLKGRYTVNDWAETRIGRSAPEALDEMAKLLERAIARHPQDQRLRQCIRIVRHAKRRPW